MHTWYIYFKSRFFANECIYISITKSYAYRKAPSSALSDILTTEKQIAESLDLDDRIDAFAEKEAFVTLKDHKPNFANNPSCRIINPAKSEIGIISQKIFQRINSEVVKATGRNQWKNTHSVIEWFKNIQSKPTHSFICFDIIEFYPSITEDLLRNSPRPTPKYQTKIETLSSKQKALYCSTRAKRGVNGQLNHSST